MAKYFIDTDDGDLVIKDDVGFDLPDDAAARIACLEALPDMARDKIPDGDQRVFTVRVSRSDRTPVYSATLTLVGSMADGASDRPPIK